MKPSKFLSLNQLDFLKGALVAAITAFLTGVYQFIGNGNFPSGWNQWKPIVIAAVGAFIAYLLKNLFTAAPATVKAQDTNGDQGGSTSVGGTNPPPGGLPGHP